MCIFLPYTKLVAIGNFILMDHAMHAKVAMSKFESYRITSMIIKKNFRWVTLVNYRKKCAFFCLD